MDSKTLIVVYVCILITIFVAVLCIRTRKKRKRLRIKNAAIEMETLPDLDPTGKRLERMINIQAKLAEGKGPGYAKWAELYNLKQKAQTIIFLQDNGLMNYEVLSKKVTIAIKKHQDISNQINTFEHRLQEITALEQQIAILAKSRKVYNLYRNNGCSEVFLADHIGEISAYLNAKKALDKFGTELPSFECLKAEYADVLARKKELYPACTKARFVMEQLTIAQANYKLIHRL